LLRTVGKENNVTIPVAHTFTETRSFPNPFSSSLTSRAYIQHDTTRRTSSLHKYTYGAMSTFAAAAAAAASLANI